MRKRFVVALLLGAFLAQFAPALSTRAFALSDAEYKKLMKNTEFTNADKALNAAWKEAKQSLSKDAFDALKKDQQTWIKSGRDNRAKALMKSGLSRVSAYAKTTNERAEHIMKLARGSEADDSVGGYDADLPGSYDNDLPDLPDDVPLAQPQRDTSSSSKKASGKISLSSSDEASDALMDRLYQLDRVSPGDELSDLDTQTEINGESCWEFALMSGGLNMMMESGRYAISPSGKVYEMEDDKYVLLKTPEPKKSPKSDASPDNSETLNVRGSIKGDKVNVRKRPTTKASVVKQLNTGHPVEVLESSETDNGRWYHVKTASGTEGWVFEDYININ